MCQHHGRSAAHYNLGLGLTLRYKSPITLRVFNPTPKYTCATANHFAGWTVLLRRTCRSGMLGRFNSRRKENYFGLCRCSLPALYQAFGCCKTLEIKSMTVLTIETHVRVNAGVELLAADFYSRSIRASQMHCSSILGDPQRVMCFTRI